MLYDFLLISLKNADATRIQEELERNKLYRVQVVDNAEKAIQRIRESKVNCVVFNVESFTPDKVAFASHMREAGFNFPIVIFSTFVQREALKELQKIPKTVLIEKPFESKDVWGIADKVVQGRRVEQRIFRRFYTDQKAQLEKQTTGSNLSARIYNLSRGGAYLEVDGSGEKLSNGDILKLTIHLDKMSKAYTVDVEVVWATQKGFWAGKPAAGIRFMKATDVYRNLLEKL